MTKQPGVTAEETITRLIAEHQGTLLRLCYAMLHDAALAEDAVQEAFLKAYRGLKTYRGEAQEKTWLTAIALNVCRDMRRGGWFRHVDRAVTPEMLPAPAQDASEQDRELTAAVMNLPVLLREAVLLYYYQGMQTPQIASLLGVSHQAVSDRLARARRKLRAVMERSDDDG